MLPRVSFSLALAVLATVAAACDPVAPPLSGDVADGAFEARVSGDVQTDLNGSATFSVETEGGETVSSIALVDAASEDDAAFLLIDGQAAARTYTVGTTNTGVVLVLRDGDGGDVFAAESGSVTLTQADADLVAGSFDVVAASLTDAGERVQVYGSFSARPGVAPMGEAALRAR